MIQPLLQTLWMLGWFLLPLNVGLLIEQTNSAATLFNPYSSLTILISEFVFWIAFTLSWGDASFRKKITAKVPKGKLAFMGLILLSIGISHEPKTTALAGLHAATFLLLWEAIEQEWIPLKTVQKIFLTSVTLQALLAVGQCITQSSLGLTMLGETTFNRWTPGIGKMEWGGDPWIRAMGTFPHANILAGALGLGFLWNHLESSKNLMTKIQQGILLIGLLLTGSQGAWIGLLLALSLWQGFTFWIPLSLMGITLLVVLFAGSGGAPNESIQERITLAKISLAMLWQHPWGVGWHQFTAILQSSTEIKLQPWQFQPAHNIGLLLLNEIGLQSLILLKTTKETLIKIWESKPGKTFLIYLLALGMVDHYLWSLPQGLMLLALLLGLMTTKLR